MAGTKAQLLAGDASPVDKQPTFGVASTVTESAPVPGFDRFSVLPEERKSWGIEDDRTVAWIRNPSHWEKLEHSDRLREFSHERPGAEQVFTKEMDPITNGDLILVKYPTAHKEAEEAARTEEYRQYVEGDPGDDMDRYNKEAMKQVMYRQARQNERDGMVGPQSPTSGLSYAQAVDKYSSAQIDAEEARFRRGSRQSSFDSDDWARMVDGGRNADRREARAEARKTVAMGNSGLGKTLAQKVAKGR